MARRLFSFAFFLLIHGVATGQGAAPAPLKVLFIGNSYTGVNDLPAMVVGLAEAAGGRKLEADRHLVGGCTFRPTDIAPSSYDMFRGLDSQAEA